jgi:hemoglobin-like flavoprotein
MWRTFCFISSSFAPTVRAACRDIAAIIMTIAFRILSSAEKLCRRADAPNITQQQLIRSSFAMVAPFKREATSLFFERLSLSPEVYAFLQEGLRRRDCGLFDAIETIVNTVGDLHELVPSVRHLGLRHTGQDFSEEQYSLILDAWLWALEAVLRKPVDADLKSAWTACYAVLAEEFQVAIRERRWVPIPPC